MVYKTTLEWGSLRQRWDGERDRDKRLKDSVSLLFPRSTGMEGKLSLEDKNFFVNVLYVMQPFTLKFLYFYLDFEPDLLLFVFHAAVRFWLCLLDRFIWSICLLLLTISDGGHCVFYVGTDADFLLLFFSLHFMFRVYTLLAFFSWVLCLSFVQVKSIPWLEFSIRVAFSLVFSLWSYQWQLPKMNVNMISRHDDEGVNK